MNSILSPEVSIVEVVEFEHSNIGNVSCKRITSTNWGSGGYCIEMIPGAKIGERYELTSVLVPFGHGINWKTVEIVKIT